jgi:hypothetical protein
MPKKGLKHINSKVVKVSLDSIEENKALYEWAIHKGYPSVGAMAKVAVHQFYKRNKPKNVPAVLLSWVE